MASKRQADSSTDQALGRPTKSRPPVLALGDRERKEHQKSIGLRVKSQRQLRNWTTVDLAQATGLTPQNIRQVEAGSQVPRTWTIYLISVALQCSAGWLAYGG